MMLVRLVELRRVDFVKKGKGTTIFTVHGTLKILATNRTRSRWVLGGRDNSTQGRYRCTTSRATLVMTQAKDFYPECLMCNTSPSCTM